LLFGENAPVATRISSPIFEKLTPRTKQICQIYASIVTPGFTHVDAVELMVKLNITEFVLDTLPEGIQLPLREALLRCQEQPPTTWSATELKLVGRDDLAMLTGELAKRDFRWAPPPPKEPPKDVVTVANEEAKERDAPRNPGAFDEKTEQDRQAICRLIYKDDRRLQEAVKLLQTSKPPVVRCVLDPNISDKDACDAENSKGMMAAVRTLATPVGRGLLYFSTRMPIITERYPINGFALSVIIRPSGRRTEPNRTQLSEDKISWAFFHAGVAAGLNISRDAVHIDSSWVVFNKPKDVPSYRHAGFLLGLGLNGHLKTIVKWHAFKYLTPKHTMTSIGLLLGLAASFIGTMNTMVTKLLSVHVTRLLPPGSAELNLSALTQAAGVMGIGLLYCGTQHRRMSEVMLSEIEYIEPQDSCVPTDTLRNEGYRLAAGFSLGFICLGRGQDLKGLGDLHIVERLLALAVDSKEVALAHVLDKTTAGATVAIALMYLKTNDVSLAKKIDIPDTQHLFDYIRPDILLLRTVAKHLILWDSIEGSFEWVKENMKGFIRERYLLTETKELESEDMPLFNVVAGLCFSIALKYAGSGDEEVRDLLLHYLDQFMRLCSLPGKPSHRCRKMRDA
jgi:anaphase-promoting complex subunit 1